MSEIERTSLETHVELCSERYDILNGRLNSIDSQLSALNARLSADVHTQYKTYLTWAGVLITSLIGIVIHLMLR